MIRIAPLPLADLRAAGVAELLELHWREVAHYQDRVPLEPDWDRYRALEEAGRLFILGAFDAQQLIGYAVWILGNHLHYQSCLVAANDVIFLLPEYRGYSTAGVRLVRESERYLKQLEVHRITWHIKPEHDWSALLRRQGYDQEEIILGKYIGADLGTPATEHEPVMAAESVN